MKKKKKKKRDVEDAAAEQLPGLVGTGACVLLVSAASNLVLSAVEHIGPTSRCCTRMRADGKPISSSAVSVQTGKTYEQEFSLEIEKAKVRFPSRWWLVCRYPELLSLSVFCQYQLCIATGGQGEEHAVGLVIPGAAPDLAR